MDSGRAPLSRPLVRNGRPGDATGDQEVAGSTLGLGVVT